MGWPNRFFCCAQRLISCGPSVIRCRSVWSRLPRSLRIVEVLVLHRWTRPLDVWVYLQRPNIWSLRWPQSFGSRAWRLDVLTKVFMARRQNLLSRGGRSCIVAERSRALDLLAFRLSRFGRSLVAYGYWLGWTRTLHRLLWAYYRRWQDWRLFGGRQLTGWSRCG